MVWLYQMIVAAFRLTIRLFSNLGLNLATYREFTG
jgi:hypothetical protein